MKQDQKTEAVDLGWLCAESGAPSIDLPSLSPVAPPRAPFNRTPQSSWTVCHSPNTGHLLPLPFHSHSLSFHRKCFPSSHPTHISVSGLWSLLHKVPCTVSFPHTVLHALDLYHALTLSSLAVELASPGPTISPALSRQTLSRSFGLVPQRPEWPCTLLGPQPALITLH